MVDKTTVICVAIIMIFGFLCVTLFSYRSANPPGVFADTNGKIVPEKIWKINKNHIVPIPELVLNPKAKYKVGNMNQLFSANVGGK